MKSRKSYRVFFGVDNIPLLIGQKGVVKMKTYEFGNPDIRTARAFAWVLNSYNKIKKIGSYKNARYMRNTD